jgi:hypothetical protein
MKREDRCEAAAAFIYTEGVGSANITISEPVTVRFARYVTIQYTYSARQM